MKLVLLAVLAAAAVLAWYVIRYGLPHDDESIGDVEDEPVGIFLDPYLEVVARGAA